MSSAGPPVAARVRILGPLEARLQPFDRVVLGGLVEGTWPPEARSDPWLSRPMRHDLGLDLPERRIGLSAHDFAQLLGAPEVILTRAAKIAGAPTVASRFLQRLAAVAGEERWQQALERGAHYYRAGAHARYARTRRAHRAAGADVRRSRCGRRASRSPRSSTGCAIPTRSTPSTSCELLPLDAVDTRAGRARPRHGHPRRGRRLHEAHRRRMCRPIRLPSCLRSAASVLRRSMTIRRRAHSGGRASSALRAGSCPGRSSARATWRRRTPKSMARLTLPFGERTLPLEGARRPHRTPCRRELRHRRLQDRHGADREAGAHRPCAAAHARSGDPAPGRLSRHRRGRVRRRVALCAAARGRATRQAVCDRFQGRHARQPGRPRIGAAHEDRCAFRGPGDALSLARASDVEAALRRLRPSRAREGVGGGHRRGVRE